AITSSQLEGAATTREAAKDMIQRGRRPRNRSERMIYNNYEAMRFIRELKDTRLTPKTVLKLQRVLTHDTLDDAAAAGRFRRQDEDICVSDELGHVLHRPPAASELEERMQQMCDFANEVMSGEFVHPVTRA